VPEGSKRVGITDRTHSRWWREYNWLRPPSTLGYRPPTPEAVRLVPTGAIPAFLLALICGAGC
jgi:hypothetical protein